MKRSVTALALIVFLSAAVSMAQTNQAGKVKFLRKTGGFVTREVGKGENVVSLIDKTGRGGAELAAFRARLTALAEVPVVIGRDDEDTVVKIFLSEKNAFTIDVASFSAIVPMGKDSEATQGNLEGAFLALCAISAKLMTQEGLALVAAAMAKHHMEPVRRATYRRAVEEGWAPPPTNDYQKAIWDAAHTNTPAAAF